MSETFIYQWDSLHFNLNGTPKLTVLGDPVRHSLSPAMHNAALAKLSQTQPRFCEWVYIGIEVPVTSLRELLAQLWEKGFEGINLTIPHKVEALKWVEAIDPEAAQIGAVNTLVRTEKGWKGYNSDGFGILKALEQDLGVSPSERDVIILGAGGASRAIAVACLNANCRRLTIVNRSEERLNELLANLKSIDTYRDRSIRGASADQFPDDLESGCVIINATSLGLKTSDPSPVAMKSLHLLKPFIYDTTYGCENELSRSAKAHGIPYSNGLSMLIWQGVKSLSIWTQSEISAEEMFHAAREQLSERQQKGDH